MIVDIELGVYPFSVIVIMNESDKAIRSFVDKSYYLSKTEIDEIIELLQLPKNCNGRYVMNPTNNSFIRLNHIPVSPVQYGYLQHEILHAVFTINRRMGLHYSPRSEEAFTYMLQYITEKVYEAIENEKAA